MTSDVFRVRHNAQSTESQQNDERRYHSSVWTFAACDVMRAEVGVTGQSDRLTPRARAHRDRLVPRARIDDTSWPVNLAEGREALFASLAEAITCLDDKEGSQKEYQIMRG
jgi:hypothetical protein